MKVDVILATNDNLLKKNDKTKTAVTNTWNKRIVWRYLLDVSYTSTYIFDSEVTYTCYQDDNITV